MTLPRLSTFLLAAACAACTATAPPIPPAVVASEQWATTVPDNANYLRRVNYQVYMRDYLALRRSRPADLIFIGDSITESWRWGPGRDVWDRFYEARAINFGESADCTQHVLWRLDNLDIAWARPRAAVVLIGTNNVDDTPEAIVAGVKAIIEKTRSKFPGVKVIVTSILPNARRTEKMAATNVLLARLGGRTDVVYFDLAAHFPPTPDGNWRGLSGDKLHPSADGYATMATALNALLVRELN